MTSLYKDKPPYSIINSMSFQWYVYSHEDKDLCENINEEIQQQMFRCKIEDLGKPDLIWLKSILSVIPVMKFWGQGSTRSIIFK